MPAYYNASIRNLTYRLRVFRDSLPTYLERVIRDNEDAIVSAVRNQLYQRGINGRGEKIMDYAPYKLRTIANKRKKGQPTTRVTLKDTGDFYAGMYVVTDSEGFYVTSSDGKRDDLVVKYGATIFRLTDDNLTRIIRVRIRRDLQKQLRRVLKK